jgi:hypothetical protein
MQFIVAGPQRRSGFEAQQLINGIVPPSRINAARRPPSYNRLLNRLLLGPHQPQANRQRLAADVNHICQESGCGAVLGAERIPISDAARRMNDNKSPLDPALGDGEDFELVFAVAPEDGRHLLATQTSKMVICLRLAPRCTIR